MASNSTVTVPPVPYKSQLTDEQGLLSQPWSSWFRQLFSRIGGAAALSNLDLATIQLVDLSVANANIAALQATTTTLTAGVSTLNSSIAALTSSINDLGQGRDL